MLPQQMQRTGTRTRTAPPTRPHGCRQQQEPVGRGEGTETARGSSWAPIPCTWAQGWSQETRANCLHSGSDPQLNPVTQPPPLSSGERPLGEPLRPPRTSCFSSGDPRPAPLQPPHHLAQGSSPLCRAGSVGVTMSASRSWGFRVCLGAWGCVWGDALTSARPLGEATAIVL